MRTETMSLAKIFDMETVAAICCPEPREEEEPEEFDEQAGYGISLHRDFEREE